MNKDSVYQQLRSHLAYLNLTAAAETLPTHLDQARQHNIGHTQFLEELLRVEVETTEQRRWATRLKLANFPTRGNWKTMSSEPLRIRLFRRSASWAACPSVWRRVAKVL